MSRPARGGLSTRPVLVGSACLLALGLAACQTRDAPGRRRAPTPVPEGAHIEEISPDSLRDESPPPPIADRAPVAHDEDSAPPRVIERALATDSEYDNDEPEAAIRYVYRVRLVVPSVLGEDHSDLAIPAAELFVDVSADRLRARFVGPGWPVAAGSEVRLRGDSPGVYLFDRSGGRSMAPGTLAEWFEGGEPRRGPQLMVSRELGRDVEERPGALVCALLSEWMNEPRSSIARRCERGAPPAFRVGFWRAERTAEVPVELPRRVLRGDEVDAPPAPGAGTSRAFLEPAALARIPAAGPRVEVSPPVDESPPGEGLEFTNESEARVLVAAEGVVIGWVDAGATALFVGLRPGVYRIAAMRPLGSVVMRPRAVTVPGRTTLRARRRRPDE